MYIFHNYYILFNTQMHILNSWMLGQLMRFQILITSNKEVVLSPISDGWFVSFFSRITQKQQNRFPRNLDRQCVSVQNRPNLLLVWIQD